MKHEWHADEKPPALKQCHVCSAGVLHVDKWAHVEKRSQVSNKRHIEGFTNHLFT